MEALIARAVQVLIALGGAYMLTLWFALVVWTFQDIQARSRSVVAQIFSTLVVMIFFLPGLLVYMVLRPRYTLDDAFQRSLEEEYLMQDLEELPLCPGCQQYIEDEWVFCPSCRTELRDNCVSCGRLVDLQWEICPYCGSEQEIEEDEPVPAPHRLPQPAFQFIGPARPSDLERVTVRELGGAENEQRTRPIIPATVRVDLRSGDMLTDPVRQLEPAPLPRALGALAPPRRVALGRNGTERLRDEITASSIAEPDSDLSSELAANEVEMSQSDHGESPDLPVAEVEASEPEYGANVPVDEVSSTEAAVEPDGDEPTEQPIPSPRRSKSRRRRARKERSGKEEVDSGRDTDAE